MVRPDKSKLELYELRKYVFDEGDRLLFNILAIAVLAILSFISIVGVGTICMYMAGASSFNVLPSNTLTVPTYNITYTGQNYTSDVSMIISLNNSLENQYQNLLTTPFTLYKYSLYFYVIIMAIYAVSVLISAATIIIGIISKHSRERTKRISDSYEYVQIVFINDQLMACVTLFGLSTVCLIADMIAALFITRYDITVSLPIIVGFFIQIAFGVYMMWGILKVTLIQVIDNLIIAGKVLDLLPETTTYSSLVGGGHAEATEE